MQPQKQSVTAWQLNKAYKSTATPIMQVYKVCKRWLRIFLTIKSPDEWVITKQACRDESIVSFFFLFSIYVYIYLCVCVRACVCMCAFWVCLCRVFFPFSAVSNVFVKTKHLNLWLQVPHSLKFCVYLTMNKSVDNRKCGRISRWIWGGASEFWRLFVMKFP